MDCYASMKVGSTANISVFRCRVVQSRFRKVKRANSPRAKPAAAVRKSRAALGIFTVANSKRVDTGSRFWNIITIRTTDIRVTIPSLTFFIFTSVFVRARGFPGPFQPERFRNFDDMVKKKSCQLH